MAILRIATWNISGGRCTNSARSMDYREKEDLAMFVDCLTAQDPDIVCLQECHTKEQRSMAADIAGRIGLTNVYDAPVSPSHIDPDCRLGIAGLFRNGPLRFTVEQYPYPKFEMRFSDGRPAAVHHKNFQIFDFDEFCLVNTHMFNLELFGYSYDRSPGLELAGQMQKTLLDAIGPIEKPLMICGDFNQDYPSKSFPQLYERYGLSEALVATRTVNDPNRPSQRPDHFLSSHDLLVRSANLLTMPTDHNLAIVEVYIE